MSLHELASGNNSGVGSDGAGGIGADGALAEVLDLCAGWDGGDVENAVLERLNLGGVERRGDWAGDGGGGEEGEEREELELHLEGWLEVETGKF